MATASTDGPAVTRDPRFTAGRTLVKTGRADEGAVDFFATLLEETLSKYEETSIDAAACYYEYGNALFRAMRLQETVEEADAGTTDEAKQDARSKAAEAAQKRAQKSLDTKPPAKESQDDAQGSMDSKPPAKESTPKEEQVSQNDSKETDVEPANASAVAKAPEIAESVGKDDEEESDDVQLALEMMETAWSILDKYIQDQNDQGEPVSQWAVEQIPRVLLGIGDVLTALTRHADAADTYSRALEHRESALQGISREELTLEHLRRRRHVVEANVLVAEALLECPEGVDVVTTETGDVLVTAAERVDYARGYYDKARDELQETVFLMGRIAAAGQDLGTEKEDVCFLATMLMGVGTTLAEHDERKAQAEADGSGVPPGKRQKT